MWLGLGLIAFGLGFSLIFGMFDLCVVAEIFIYISLSGAAIAAVSALIATILIICDKYI